MGWEFVKRGELLSNLNTPLFLGLQMKTMGRKLWWADFYDGPRRPPPPGIHTFV